MGDGTTTDRLKPLKIAEGVISASCGTGHTVFVKKDYTLWAVGNNSDGELGDGSKVNRLLPVKIMEGVARAVAGQRFTLILKLDGTAWTTGDNLGGRPGDGNNALFYNQNNGNPISACTRTDTTISTYIIANRITGFTEEVT
ncbi:MAG: hypothetical protein EOO00_03865 [Chitinophagaceae bacterium]|nr:MAG: hypothetical protein EOO00_03865 [Chitinophagaceae bacterium]